MKAGQSFDGMQRMGSASSWDPPIVDPGHRIRSEGHFVTKSTHGVMALLEELERERAVSRRAEADLARVLDEVRHEKKGLGPRVGADLARVLDEVTLNPKPPEQVGVQIAKSRKLEEENAALIKVTSRGQPHHRSFATPEDEEVQNSKP